MTKSEKLIDTNRQMVSVILGGFESKFVMAVNSIKLVLKCEVITIIV